MKNNITDKIVSGISRLVLTYTRPLPARKTLEFTDQYDLVILCATDQTEMLKECLKSIYKHFRKIPHIFIFTALNVDMDACKKAVRWFPAGSLNIIRGSDCLNYHLKHQKTSVISFAQSNPMGLKLAATLQMLNAGKPIICSEANVLWYDDPLPVIKPYLDDPKVQIIMAQQSFPVYDEQLIENAKLDSLNQAPYLSSSLLLLKKLSAKNRKTLDLLLKMVESGSNLYSEQTIFAYLNKENDHLAFDQNAFRVVKQETPENAAGIVAGVYTGDAQRLFWRHALLHK